MSDNITIVSGYWKVKNKYSHEKYSTWFQNSLKINQRYFFYCDEKDKDYIKTFRTGYDTIFTHYPLENFYSERFYRNPTLHSLHVPSYELGKIWHEKMHLLKLTKDNDTNPTDFYVWCDAGVCIFRDFLPPQHRLNLKDANSLPHDKVCYSWARDDDHCFAATVLIMHKNMIDLIHDLFYEYLEKCCKNMVGDWRTGSDQFIFTQILHDYPEHFFKISHNYGMNLVVLYNLS